MEYLIKPLRDEKNKLLISLKVLVIVFCCVFFLKYFTVNAMGQFTHSRGVDIFAMIIRWALIGSPVYLIMAVFFNNKKMKDVATWIILPLVIITLIFSKNYIDTTCGFDISTGLRIFTIVQYSLELCLLVSCVVLLILKYGVEKKNYWSMLKTFAIVFFLTTPLNILQFLQNIISQDILDILRFKVFGAFHIIIMLYVAVITTTIYFALKNKDEEYRWNFLRIMALVLFVQFMSNYSMVIQECFAGTTKWFARLPLQVCYIGIPVAVAAILTKNKFLLDLIFFVNAGGALSSIIYIGLDTSGEVYLFSFKMLLFVFEHSFLFILSLMPVLIKSHKINVKNIWKAVVTFAVFFIAVVIFNAAIATIQFPNPDGTVSQFFPNYCYTQIPPFYLPIKFTTTYIGKMAFQFGFIALAFIGFIVIALVFQGIYWLGVYLKKYNDTHKDLPETPNMKEKGRK